MERLTRRMCGGWGLVEGCEINTTKGMRRIVERLAAYENTGLAPAEICSMQAEWDVARQLADSLRAQKEVLAPIDPYEGLKRKYIVRKSDTGEPVENCFVLRPDKDSAAVAALRAYAGTTDNETLAADIIKWVGAEKNEPLTKEQVKGMVGDWVWVVVQYEHCQCEGWGLIPTPAYVAYLDQTLPTDFYGKKFVAYRCPPEGAHK